MQHQIIAHQIMAILKIIFVFTIAYLVLPIFNRGLWVLDNINRTAGNRPVKMDDYYYCLPKTGRIPTLYVKEKFPDDRFRLFVSNRLLHIAKEFVSYLFKVYLISFIRSISRFILICSITTINCT